MRHLMQTYLPPESLLRATVSKLSLKPIPTLKNQLQRLREWRATEKIKHKTKWWDLEACKKSFRCGRRECNDRENELE